MWTSPNIIKFAIDIFKINVMYLASSRGHYVLYLVRKSKSTRKHCLVAGLLVRFESVCEGEGSWCCPFRVFHRSWEAPATYSMAGQGCGFAGFQLGVLVQGLATVKCLL